MKYFGFLELDTPEDTWVWVCDDDQLYKTDRVSDAVQVLSTIPPEQQKNTVITFDGFNHLFVNTIIGVKGVFIHKTMIRKAKAAIEAMKNVPDCCFMIDDNLMSIALKKVGARILDTPCTMDRIFENGTDNKEAEDALHTAHNRSMDQLQCSWQTDDSFQAIVITLSIILGIALIFMLVYTIKYEPRNDPDFYYHRHYHDPMRL
jgi:hypothetical protein